MNKQAEESLREQEIRTGMVRGTLSHENGQAIAQHSEPKAQRLSAAINKVDSLDHRLNILICDLTDGLTDEPSVTEAKPSSPSYSVADLMANGASILTEKIICCEKKVDHLRDILL